MATTLLDHEADPEKRWDRLCQVHRELSRLRRDDHRAVRTFIARQEWDRKTDREDAEDSKREQKDELGRLFAQFMAPSKSGTLAKPFDLDEFAPAAAAPRRRGQKAPGRKPAKNSIATPATPPSPSPTPDPAPPESTGHDPT
jgi:hypothetical protein